MTRRALFLTVVFVAFWAWLEAAARPAAPPAREPLARLPLQIGGWQGKATAPLDDRVVALLGADDYVSRTYENADDVTVSLYIGYHNSQRQGDSIHSPMNCLPGAGWAPVRSDRIQVPDRRTTDGAASVNEVIVEKGDQRQVVLYWYQSQGHIVASEYVAKAQLFLDALRTARTDAALVRIMIPVGKEDEPTARDVARKFAAELVPVLGPYLPN
jgi:EpsI family protein